MHGALNHLLAADRIWMRRFTGEGDAPQTLDAILHDAFTDLRVARQAEVRRISTFVEGLDADALHAKISYRGVTHPTLVEQELWSALAHFFNHQTHHRGQIHAMLTKLTGEALVLDLIAFQRGQAQLLSGS